MQTYKNDPKLKRMVVKEMEEHRKQDQFIQGDYSRTNGKFSGCAVGCAIDSFNRKLGTFYGYADHTAFEETIEVPEYFAHLADSIYEGIPLDEASKFAVDFFKAIPEGVSGKQMDVVRWKFNLFILDDVKDTVKSLKDIKVVLKKELLSAIKGSIKVNEEAIKTGEWDDDKANAAARAAWAAAWAAEMAASNVSWSESNVAIAASGAAAIAASNVAIVAWAESNAERADKIRLYAKELLGLLKGANQIKK